MVGGSMTVGSGFTLSSGAAISSLTVRSVGMYVGNGKKYDELAFYSINYEIQDINVRIAMD
jgi:hypothetical protein